jgi:hypothetical protein
MDVDEARFEVTDEGFVAFNLFTKFKLGTKDYEWNSLTLIKGEVATICCGVWLDNILIYGVEVVIRNTQSSLYAGAYTNVQRVFK